MFTESKFVSMLIVRITHEKQIRIHRLKHICIHIFFIHLKCFPDSTCVSYDVGARVGTFAIPNTCNLNPP